MTDITTDITTTRFTALALKGIQGLHPYQPGKPIEELERELGVTDTLKLASNENPLGASSHALRALQDPLETLQLYPDGAGFALKNKLAESLSVLPEQVTLGNGSNDVLDMVARCFLSEGLYFVVDKTCIAYLIR